MCSLSTPLAPLQALLDQARDGLVLSTPLHVLYLVIPVMEEEPTRFSNWDRFAHLMAHLDVSALASLLGWGSVLVLRGGL